MFFDPTLPTELHTDASSIGYGAILFQKHDGLNKVVGYFSRRTTSSDSRYHSYELETLAIFNALKHFRVYLLGIEFTIVTDCNSIKSTATKKDIVPRVSRWWAYFQDFKFEIKYRKGSAVAHVDYLSRNPPVETHSVNNIRHRTLLEVEQAADAETAKLIDDYNDSRLDRKQYRVKNQLLYHVNHRNGKETLQWYVPKASRIGLLRLFHDEQCHVGLDKTVDDILNNFWFPRLRQFVKKYVAHCLKCNFKKSHMGPKQGHLHPIEKLPIPFHTIHLDCLGPFPLTQNKDRFLLVFVDSFTKYCVLLPVPNLTAPETRDKFQHFMSFFGTPCRVITDSGTNFKNKDMLDLFNDWCVPVHYITPGVPRANGQVERYMRTISNLIRIVADIPSEWTSRLWKIQLTLNTT